MSESVDIVQSFHQLWLALRDFAALRLSMFSTTLDRLLGHIGLGSHKGKVSKGLLIRIGNRLFLDGKGQKTERDVKKVAKEEMSREERRQKRKEERLARKQNAGASTSTQNTTTQNTTTAAAPAALPTADVSGLFDELKRLRQELTKLSETTTGAGGAAAGTAPVMPRAGNAAPPPPPPPPMPGSASSSSGVRGVGGPSVAGTARPAAEHAPAAKPAFLSEIKAGVGAEKLRRVSMMKPTQQQQQQQQQQLGARARQHQNPVSPGDVLTMALKKKFQNANKRESMEAETAPKEPAVGVDLAANNENSENNSNLPTTPQKVSTPSKLLNVSSNVTLRNSPRGSPLVHTPVRTNHTAADDNDDEWK